jgi:DNA adenine methylase
LHTFLEYFSAFRRDEQIGAEIMNVRSTPLRYPGGKQKIAPFVSEMIQYNNLENVEYVEPYAGGAGVAIYLLLNNIVNKIHLNDSDSCIYAFWKTLIDKTEWLCKKILYSSLTIEEWLKQREILRHRNDNTLEDIGFATFYLNRCNRSGILNGGVIGGLQQSGVWKMNARFSRKSLIQRIEVIAEKRKMITVTNMDAEIILKEIKTKPQIPSCLIYCDPPYLRKSEKLYLNHYNYEDHSRIATLIQSITNCKWLVSYDYSDYIFNLYEGRNSFRYGLQYNASNVYLGEELFIFSDNLAIPKQSKLPRINSALTERVA